MCLLGVLDTLQVTENLEFPVVEIWHALAADRFSVPLKEVHESTACAVLTGAVHCPPAPATGLQTSPCGSSTHRVSRGSLVWLCCLRLFWKYSSSRTLVAEAEREAQVGFLCRSEQRPARLTALSRYLSPVCSGKASALRLEGSCHCMCFTRGKAGLGPCVAHCACAWQSTEQGWWRWGRDVCPA